MPGVEVCNVHHVFLHETPVTIGSYALREIIPASTIAITKPTSSINPLNISHQVLLTLADNVAWLLNQKEIIVEGKHLRSFYTYLFVKQGFLGKQSSFNGEAFRFDMDYLVKTFVDWISGIEKINEAFYGSTYKQLKSNIAKRMFQEDFFLNILNILMLRPDDLKSFHNLILAQFLVSDLNKFLNAFLEFREIYISEYLKSNTFRCVHCKVEWLPLEESLGLLNYDYQTGLYLGNIICPNCNNDTIASLSICKKDTGLALLKVSKPNFGVSKRPG